MPISLDEVLLRMGFVDTDTGPYVTELRAHVAKQIANGMVSRSGGTWAEDCYERDDNGFITGYKISAEDRAKAILAMDWEIEHAHSCCIECVDGFPLSRTFVTRTMRRGLRVNLSRLRPWLRDLASRFAMNRRIRRDKRAGLVNPYV